MGNAPTPEFSAYSAATIVKIEIDVQCVHRSCKCNSYEEGSCERRKNEAKRRNIIRTFGL